MESPATVRAWVWSALEAHFSSRAAASEWPGAKESSQDLDAFVRVLRTLDGIAARGDGSFLRDTGQAIARQWGRHYQLLVEDYRGRPDRLLRLFVEEIYPDAFGDAAPRHSFERDRATFRFAGALPPPFTAGLLEGFVALAGARPALRTIDHQQVTIAWRLEGGARTASFLQVGAAAVRLPFLVATIVPVFVALSIAAGEGHVNVPGAVLTLLGVLAFQFGSNALNDYYDRRTGEDQTLPEAVRRAPASWIGRAAYAYYSIGVAIGLFLVARHGIEILWLGLAGFLLGVLYTAPPVRLAYRGLGELAVAVGFGPLIVLGTYFVQRHTWSLDAFLASVPLAFLIAAVLYLHEMPDRAGDARVGKRTLIVRLPERPAVIVYVILQALTYVLIVGGVALAGIPSLAAYAFPAWSLLGVLTLPLAARATVMLARNYRYPYRLVPTNAAAVRLHLVTAILFAAGYAIPWP